MSETVYLLENNLGGIASLCANLIRYRPEDAAPQSVLLLTNIAHTTPKVTQPMGAASEQSFEFSSQENAYGVVARLSRALPAAGGALVSNSGVELGMLGVHQPRQTVYHIVHDAYNLGLVRLYESVIDVMIAHSRYFYEQLLKELPHRADSIFHLPYGIRLAGRQRQAAAGPLRLIFLGRLAVEKGVHDLPVIDAHLTAHAAAVRWTIIGNGPERENLMRSMPPDERVRYASPATNAEVLELCADGDVFVLPTRFEGFPVALLEAMSAGLVPVVTDLPSGVPEVVGPDSGFRIPMGDAAGFAEAIIRLNADRALLEAMSKAARARSESFDIAERAAAYHALFARWAALKKVWGGPLPIKLGHRLDQPYLPNCVTWALRTVYRRMRGALEHAGA